MQHHTLGSGTAEFQVTWPPKVREGTYLVKNVRARFEYRKTIAAHEKQVIMQEKTQPCASLWRKTLRPKRVRFLAIDAPIVDFVCLPLYHLTFLGSYQPVCEFSWRKKKEKARKKGSGFIDKILTWVSGLPRSATTPIHHFVQYAKVTLLEISPCQGPTVKRSGVAYSCSYALLVLINTSYWYYIIPKTIGNRKRDCAWGCARRINTTSENLQIEKHKSGRRSFRSPDWFVLFDLQIFSGGV